MDPADDNAAAATGAAPEAGATAEPQAAAQPAAEQPEAERPAAEQPAAERPADGKAVEAKPERRRTLLEEADDPEQDAPQGGDGAVDSEKLAKFTDGIRALDLGEGVKFDDAAFASIAPELMELSGGDPAKAEKLVRKYVEGEVSRARAAQEAQDAFVAELRNQCRQRWGADVRSVARAASRGGAAVFGDRIWNEMKSIETFANNPDIMERLAMVGRRVAEDGGAVHPAGQEAEDTRDVIARMYGGVK